MSYLINNFLLLHFSMDILPCVAFSTKVVKMTSGRNRGAYSLAGRMLMMMSPLITGSAYTHSKALNKMKQDVTFLCCCLSLFSTFNSVNMKALWWSIRPCLSPPIRWYDSTWIIKKDNLRSREMFFRKLKKTEDFIFQTAFIDHWGYSISFTTVKTLFLLYRWTCPYVHVARNWVTSWRHGIFRNGIHFILFFISCSFIYSLFFIFDKEKGKVVGSTILKDISSINYHY